MILTLRAWLAFAGIVAVLAGAGGLYWKGHHDAAAKLKPQIEAAKVQDHVDQAATAAVDHYTEHVTILHDKAQKAADAVQAAPGADAPIPPDVRAAWLDGLRNVTASDADPSAKHPSS